MLFTAAPGERPSQLPGQDPPPGHGPAPYPKTVLTQEIPAGGCLLDADAGGPHGDDADLVVAWGSETLWDHQPQGGVGPEAAQRPAAQVGSPSRTQQGQGLGKECFGRRKQLQRGWTGPAPEMMGGERRGGEGRGQMGTIGGGGGHAQASLEKWAEILV